MTSLKGGIIDTGHCLAGSQAMRDYPVSEVIQK